MDLLDEIKILREETAWREEGTTGNAYSSKAHA